MRRRSVPAKFIAVATAAVTSFALTAPVATGAPVDAGSSNIHDPGFYTTPAALPEENGGLVKSEPMPLLASVPDLSAGSMTPGQWPAEAQRIMYRSTGARGDAVPVTGMYLESTVPWEGPGERPLAVVAPGTMGQGDQCAASKAFTPGLMVDLERQSISPAYEYLSTYNLVMRGFSVVVTDYEGLGMPGTHTYVNREAQGHAVIDAARAATRVPGAEVGRDSNVVFTGYSQGGGAAASGAELQPTYGADVNLVGTAAGAPPADLAEVMPAVDGSGIAGVVGYAINGLIDSYPEIEDDLKQHMSPEGHAALDRLSGECIGDSVLSFGFRTTSELTTDGRSATELLAAEPAIAQRIAQQRIGDRPPSTPVQVVAGRHDDAIPFGQQREMAVDWCEGGTQVDFLVDETPEVLPGFAVNHVAPLIGQVGRIGDYLTDRASGVPAPTNCGVF